MLIPWLLGCGPDRMEPVAELVAPLELPPSADRELPERFVALVVRPDRAVVTAVGEPMDRAEHALDPDHPEMAEALWPLALGGTSATASAFVLVLDRRADPALGESAMRAASAEGFTRRYAIGVGP